MTQLRSDEIIVLFGCLPPANASRYFGATGYLYSLYDNTTSAWINTFGSMGDTLHVVRQQEPANYGLKRINSSLPYASVTAYSSPILLGGVSKSRGWMPLWHSAISDLVTGSSGSADNNILPPSGFGEFTVILMTADPKQAETISSIIARVLQASGIRNAINVLPIPGPVFSSGAIGLDPLSNYYMLLLRNILPSSYDAGLWSSYTASTPFHALRVTPATPSAPPSPAFPLPKVISRQPPDSFKQTELWLKPAFDDLMKRVTAKYGAGNALAWSIGSSSYLNLLGVDYGADCVKGKINVCEGDNRDASYISSFPFVELSHQDQVVWALGINHVATGFSTWLSISITDPVAKAGLFSFSDEEIPGSADELMQGSEYSSLSPYLFAVQFARDCTGRSPWCKEIPTSGAKSLPLLRAGLVMMRAYVNSATGVGPDSTHMLTFRTVVMTPASEARAYDSLPQESAIDLSSSPCAIAMLKSSTCISGAGAFCCSAVTSFNIQGCFCSPDGAKVLNLLPMGSAKAAMLGADVLCGTRSNFKC